MRKTLSFIGTASLLHALALNGLAQEADTLLAPIPTNRAMFTDRVKAQIKKADLRDGSADKIIEVEDTAASATLTEVFLHKAPLAMIHIENMNIAHQQKIFYHKALESTLQRMYAKGSNADAAYYDKKLFENFEGMLAARQNGRLADFVEQNLNSYSMDNGELLDDYPELKAKVFAAVGRQKPEMMIKRLPEFARETYADPIIASAAQVLPGTILTYAQSNGQLGAAVRRNTDPLVRAIVQIADQAKSPLKVLPFVNSIKDGKLTIAQADALGSDPKAYFQALVKLKIDGAGGAEKALDDEIAYRGLQFVRVVNELHDQPAAVRFKSLLDFGAEDLYFMILGSQDEIYTSSYIWMMDRIMEKMKPLTGDQFLGKVHQNHFRTFIRMAAGYNKLSAFLNTMDEEHKNTLMKSFVNGLEKGPLDDLEDAVDVADAFGSLSDPKLIAYLKEEVRANYEKKVNEKGVIVYALLYTIFNNANSDEQLNRSTSDLLPPIISVPIASLKDDSGRIVQQVFFYGDKDGFTAYNGYLNLFRNKNWKIEQNNYWATVTATGPEKIIIFANKPLNEEAEENDEFAQKKLQDHINQQGLHPSVVIHRGHSYYLNTTLEHLTPSAKIVVLGSCGGYHNLAKVLDASPDANIISSKQVGAYAVNTPIINALNETLLAGKDVNWPVMWQDLAKYFSAKGAGLNDLFSDYVPPNKNLGAIFIKAYRKQLMAMEQ
ncbi:MAG: hypothetical protein QM642_00905 [Edaphocola sp.]